VANIILAVNSRWVTRLGHLQICVVVNCFLRGFELTSKKKDQEIYRNLLGFMLNELGDIAVEVAGLVLALVNSLAFPIAAPSDVELPLAILHQLVILVERAYENSG
jgi:hypothetical protein